MRVACRHRAAERWRVGRRDGTEFTVYDCGRRTLCSEGDEGLRDHAGAALAVCASCPLYEATGRRPQAGDRRPEVGGIHSSLQPPASSRPKLTIGLATFRDWPGVWATIQSLRLHHAECLDEIEIVVVDNDPAGKPLSSDEREHSSKTRRLCERIGATYEHYTAIAGTAAAKGRIFDLATAPSVLVIDCHVLLPSGVLRRLIDWCESHPDSRDLWQGPCLGDGGLDDLVGTHFAPRWGSLMYGQWETDLRARESDQPFEIPMQGCGLFACRRDAWPGFHPLLRGFGPEEFHLHQRIRRNGGQCYCLPWLRWSHRFGNPDGARPPGLQPDQRLRGHLITHFDGGAPPLADIRRHFVDESKAVTDDQFWRVLRETAGEFWADRPDLGATCPNRGPLLRVVECEIGCRSQRGHRPIYACTRHGECSPSRWQQRVTMMDCAWCLDSGPDRSTDPG